jgi:hypothetical protein
MPEIEIEIEDGVSRQKFLLREIPENVKEKFLHCFRHLKVYAIIDLQCIQNLCTSSCMLLTFKATNDHAHQILHYAP